MNKDGANSQANVVKSVEDEDDMFLAINDEDDIFQAINDEVGKTK